MEQQLGRKPDETPEDFARRRELARALAVRVIEDLKRGALDRSRNAHDTIMSRGR